ncbi:MAG TPA: response regulator [Candidatus Sumerlaeota bacterium]|nr:response regulator [Candidatus Sumerlaeota bacterium]
MPRKGTILIVEDNMDHLELFAEVFDADFEVLAASDSDQCFEILRGRHCDLVILDYYLSSRFSGLDILSRITDLVPGLPVIMVTAYGNEELAVKAIKHGARDYVRKTLDNTYLDCIRKHAEDILSVMSSRGEQQPAVLVAEGVVEGNVPVVSNDWGDLLRFFERNKGLFLQKWRERMLGLAEEVSLPESFLMTNEEMDRFFDAFQLDLRPEVGKSQATARFLDQMALVQDAEAKSLLAVELLNLSFKQSVKLVFEHEYFVPFELRLAFLDCLARIVDENILSLIQSYQKLLERATSQIRLSERMATKSLLMTTLQHEIRQPLAYVYSRIELLLLNPAAVGEGALRDLLSNIVRIQEILDRIERDSHMLTKQYSDDLNLLDLPEKPS